MNSYSVFKKDNKIQLVKHGFSWPALFFNFLWFFYHNMTTYGFMWIFGYLTLDVLCALFTSSWVVFVYEFEQNTKME